MSTLASSTVRSTPFCCLLIQCLEGMRVRVDCLFALVMCLVDADYMPDSYQWPLSFHNRLIHFCYLLTRFFSELSSNAPWLDMGILSFCDSNRSHSRDVCWQRCSEWPAVYSDAFSHFLSRIRVCVALSRQCVQSHYLSICFNQGHTHTHRILSFSNLPDHSLTVFLSHSVNKRDVRRASPTADDIICCVFDIWLPLPICWI